MKETHSIFSLFYKARRTQRWKVKERKRKKEPQCICVWIDSAGGWLGLGVEILESPVETSMGGKFEKFDDLLRKLRFRPSMSLLKNVFAHAKKFFGFAVEYYTRSSREGIVNGRFHSHAELFKMVRIYPRCYLLGKWGEGRTFSRSSFTWCIVSFRNHQGRPEADWKCWHGLGHGCETDFNKSVFIVCEENKMAFTE
ncbi:hypothetical protein BJX66DRAFT_297309 [Aspergillus keveii]|uniref:Uncharacterized protein n=1 Tax=Aspergillus keveii TaxID=714993 RepID=A0ABR4GFI6_9EURO